MIKTSYHVHISYPDGGGLDIPNAGELQIITVTQCGDRYSMHRANGNRITVPIAWTLIEYITEDAPENKAEGCCQKEIEE